MTLAEVRALPHAEIDEWRSFYAAKGAWEEASSGRNMRTREQPADGAR